METPPKDDPCPFLLPGWDMCPVGFLFPGHAVLICTGPCALTTHLMPLSLTIWPSFPPRNGSV